jgi:small neutral amino acid transporter SnatA (MarC family)
MSDFIRCLVGMFAVVAPFGALATVMAGRVRASALTHVEQPARWMIGTPAAAFVVLALFALLNEPLLDWLKISPESFQFAAGAAMAPLAVRLILAGDSMPAPDRPLPSYAWFAPSAVPMLAGPSSIIAVISYAARFGESEAIMASAMACALTGALFALSERLEKVPMVVVETAARLSGGLLVLIAVELAVDGVRSV